MRNRHQLVLPTIEPATQVLTTVPEQMTPEQRADYFAELPPARTVVDRRRDPLLWVLASGLAAILVAIVVVALALF